jgi:hypothetical protein
MTVKALVMKLLHLPQAPTGPPTRVEKSADELQHERDLLERAAAGIALNKMPPR